METEADLKSGRSKWGWRVLAILGVVLAAALAWAWNSSAENRQERNIQVAVVFLIGLALLWLWLLFVSPFRRWIRVGAAAAMALGAVLFFSLFEIHGVTGDLVPIFRRRWVERSPGTSGRQSLHALKTEADAQITQDYPQFLGPNRNSVLTGVRLNPDWDLHPPVEVWRQPIGEGWSAFAISGPYAVTQAQYGEEERILCYNAASGELLWSHADIGRFAEAIGGAGPRATPTIESSHVYALGATGLLTCLDLRSGERVWQRNIVSDHSAKVPEWGMSGSPLVIEGRVIVSPGGRDGRSLAAYDASSGEPAWTGGTDAAGYSSPVLGTFHGVDHVVIFNARSVAGHDLKTGRLSWEYPWPGGHPHVAIPLLLPQNRIFISSGYGTGAALIEIERRSEEEWEAAAVWKSLAMKAKFTNPVAYEGHIYGLDDGILACISIADGRRQWKDGRYGHGQVLLVEEMLLVMGETGELVLIEPAPEQLRERARFRVFQGKVWNPPAFAAPYIFLRTDWEAVCLRLALVP